MMNIKTFLLREFFPHLKLKDPNLSLLKKVYIYLSILVQLWVVIFVLLHLVLPYIAKDTYRGNNVVFYNHTLDVNEKHRSQYFSHIEKILSEKALYDKKVDVSFHLLNDNYIYTILNPVEWLPNRQTFAVTRHTNILVRSTDILQNKVYASNNVEENLDAILIHEAMHAYQHAKYGWLYTSFGMPYWVKEGYPIYEARDLSLYGEKKLIKYMQKTKDTMVQHWSRFTQDQFYALMVKHAIEKMGKSVDELHLGKVAYDEVLDSLLDEYNITKE